MASLDDLRQFILSLPETSEGTHFRRPVFRVGDKPIISVEKDQGHVTVRLDRETIETLVNEDEGRFEEIWQNGKHLIGIRFDIANVSTEQLHRILEQSWRTKAPKKRIKNR